MYFIECSKASIYTLDNTYVCDAKVSDLTDTSALLTFPEPRVDSLHSEMLITFYDRSKGLTSFYCLLADYKEYIGEPGVWHSSVRCTMDRSISSIQRRKDVKIDIHLPVTLRYKEEDSARKAPATITNISAGGVYFTSATAFMEKQVVQFFLPAVRTDLLLTAEILRVEKTKKEGIHGYGCRFISLPTYAESSIRSFVFKQEMQKRKM